MLSLPDVLPRGHAWARDQGGPPPEAAGQLLPCHVLASFPLPSLLLTLVSHVFVLNLFFPLPQWRYAVGEDREALIKVTRQETAEDKAAKEKVHQIKGEDGAMLKLKVDKLLGRRKLKKDYEYEVRAADCTWDLNSCRGLSILLAGVGQFGGGLGSQSAAEGHAVKAREADCPKAGDRD